MTTSNCLFGKISTIYMASTQSPTFRLLRIYHFATAHLPIICLLQIDQLFHHWKSSKYLLLCIEKLYDIKSPIWKYFEDLYGYCANPNFLATAQHAIILLLRIFQLFDHSKSTYYFTSGIRLNIC